MKTFESKLQDIKISEDIKGTILDIGGGGEGVIGRAYGQSIVSIDKRQEELDEAPSECKKIVMDAADLHFENDSFDHVTSFFTMMYIPKDLHKKVLSEAYRVLKKGGKLYLWDVVIPVNTEAYQVFIVQLEVKLPKENIRTGYGVGYREQNSSYYEELLADTGFKIELTTFSDQTYKITAVKE